MTDRSEAGMGSVKTIRNRAGEIVGYQALLPRELSRAPKDVKHPQLYQEPFGDRCETYDAARTLLDAALPTLRANPLMGRGPCLGDYVTQEIQAKHQQARRDYNDAPRANRAVSTWRSIERCWLADAPFIKRAPHSITQSDLQAWFNWLKDEAESERDEPLSPAFIRNVAALVRASFARVLGLGANPAEGLQLPNKDAPKVPHLVIDQQRAFFAAPSEKVSYQNRVMVGCGMGGGLRVNELLPFEPGDVQLDCPDPHLIVRYGGPNHAPTKSRRVRRVELYEPGLGFWRLYMAHFYRPGDRLVFEGPRGGYQKAWPESFSGWGEALGLDHLTSHIMRHTFAVSLLSGSWGYEPRSLEFVGQQLGHGDRQTTERHYGAFEAGIWRREVDHMTGRGAGVSRRPVTAAELLMGGGESAGEAAPPIPSREPRYGNQPRHSPSAPQVAVTKTQSSSQLEASPQSLARAVLEAARDADPRVVAIAIRLAEAVLLAEPASANAEADAG